MKRPRINAILFIVLILSVVGCGSLFAGQDIDSEYIINKIQSRLDKIDDYSVNVDVDIDIPNLRMPHKNLKIYYKKPDKLSVKASGFAIVPKIGLMPSLKNLISEKSQVEIRNTPDQSENSDYIIDIRNIDMPEDIVTSVWINSKRWTIEKILMSSENIGESVIRIEYVNIDNIWLPATTTVYLNLVKPIPEMQRPSVEFPVGFSGNKSGQESTTGTIRIHFKDYQMNTGLADDFFTE